MGQEPRKPKGFDEAQLRFEAEVRTSCYAAWDYACGLTRRDLQAEAASDPQGYLINLSSTGAYTDPTLLIPATLDAIYAFEQGHIAIGPRYNFLVDMERINPEFLESLNPIGRLHLPSNPAFLPSLTALSASVIALMSRRSYEE